MRLARLTLLFAGLSVLLQGLAISQGLQGGLQVSGSTTWYEYIGADSIRASHGRLLPSIAVFGEKQLHEKLSLRAGLRYGSFGGKGNYSYVEQGWEGPFGSYGTFQTRQDYLSLPLWLKYSFAPDLLYALVGAELGYLVNAITNWDIVRVSSPGNGTFYTRFNEAMNTTEEIDRLNIGFGVGIGYQQLLFGRVLFAEISYVHGISRIEDRATLRSGFQIAKKARQVGLSVGVLF